MQETDLLAPESYNIMMEIEQYAKDTTKKALIYMDDEGTKREVTYAALLKNVNKVGNILLEHGLKKGQKVLVMVPRIIEAYEVYLAALKTGIIIIPCSEMLKAKDLQYRITHGEVDGVISYHTFIDVYQELAAYDQLTKFVIGGEQVADWYHLDTLKEKAADSLTMDGYHKDDIAFLPYTSGTTGNPKGVVHTHSWGYAHLRTVAKNWLDIKENDIVWATAAPGWQKWVWSPLLSTLGSGATGFVFNGRFSAEQYLSILQDEKINVLCCTPTEYRMMAKLDGLDRYNLSNLHSTVSAGEPLNREVMDIFKKYFDVTVRDGYGQTESTLLLGIMKDMEIKPGSMGKPTPGNDVTIVDAAGEPVPAGEVGDIAVHKSCPALFKGYYKDEERTARSFRGDYYITGDRAKADEEGYFWFEGRDDDIIISSGYTIGPFEVEDVIVKHHAVQECAVVGTPDEMRGQIVKAFIILKPSVEVADEAALIKEIQQFCKKNTAPYKYPRAIEFVTALPKTSSGKIRRVELRDLEKERYQQEQ